MRTIEELKKIVLGKDAEKSAAFLANAMMDHETYISMRNEELRLSLQAFTNSLSRDEKLWKRYVDNAIKMFELVVKVNYGNEYEKDLLKEGKEIENGNLE